MDDYLFEVDGWLEAMEKWPTLPIAERSTAHREAVIAVALHHVRELRKRIAPPPLYLGGKFDPTPREEACHHGLYDCTLCKYERQGKS